MRKRNEAKRDLKAKRAVIKAIGAILDAEEEWDKLQEEKIEPIPDRKNPDYFNDAEKLLTLAMEGDEIAAHDLVDAATAYTTAVGICYDFLEFMGDDWGESGDVFKRIAEDRIKWPCMVSGHRRFSLNPDSLAEYLKKLNLGGRKNLNLDKIDSRSLNKSFAAALIYDFLEKRLGKKLVRSGLERDKWLSSEHGNLVKDEISGFLDSRFPKDEWQTNLLLKAMIEAATEKAANRVRHCEGRPTVKAIKSALIKEACSVIHGMLKD